MQHTRLVGERFDMPRSTLNRSFVRIVNLINELACTYIKWPTGAEINQVKQTFARSKFKNCIGAVDGTYVAFTVSKEQQSSYTNRKNYTSMTLLAICDGNLRYTYIYAGWPSSVPDIRIFKNSDIYLNTLQDPSSYFPNGVYILGDKAYPVLNWCIRDVRWLSLVPA